MKYAAGLMCIALAAGIFTGCRAHAAAKGTAMKACRIKVVTDSVPDLTSIEALKRSIIKPGMTDDEKAKAVWRAVHEHRFWNPYQRNSYRRVFGGTDPILNLNCFAATICQQDSEMCCGLWSALGFSVRMWQLLDWHTTPEVYYGGTWRHFDATLGITTNDKDGNVTKLHDHPTWIKQSKRTYVSYTDGYVTGHRMEFGLRKGESFRRCWKPLSKDADYWVPTIAKGPPKDLFVPKESKLYKRLAEKCDPTKLARYPEGSTLLRAFDVKTRRFEPMPSDAAYANGLWTFKPDFGSKRWRELAEAAVNVAVTSTKAADRLHPRNAGERAHAVFRVTSPYVISGGWLHANVSAPGTDDLVELSVSRDRGRTWKKLAAYKETKAKDVKLPLRESVSGALEYFVKIEMQANDAPDKVGVGGLLLKTVTHMNPFALPALKRGANAVTFSAGEQVETVTIAPQLTSAGYRAYVAEEKNIASTGEGKYPGWVRGLVTTKPGEECWLVFKVEAPGPITKVRWGGAFLGNHTLNKLFYSFDGRDWKEKEWSYGQAVKDTKNARRGIVPNYETIDKLPGGQKAVWLKYHFGVKEADKRKKYRAVIRGLRIDADYVPQGLGAFPPLKVVYSWYEFQGGKKVRKEHVEAITAPTQKFTIKVGGEKEPVMESVTVSYE